MPVCRWLHEFHDRMPVLFAVMCAGIVVAIFGLVAIVVEAVGR